ncbi:MAG: L,D-transpeptidase family protein [Chitinophagaceae bacterium]
MKRVFHLLCVSVLVLAGCKNKEKAFDVAPRDHSIAMANSYNSLFFDSSQLEPFIKAETLTDSLTDRIRSFYNSRNFQYAWFDSSGLAEQAHSFLNMQSQYINYARDSSVYNPQLSQLLDSLTSRPDTMAYQITANDRLKYELLLTEYFFKYALKAYQGDNKINAQDLGWFIPRKKLDLTAVLDSVIGKKGNGNYEPVSRQYNLLKTALLKYYTIEKQGKWDSIQLGQAFTQPGQSADAIRQIKERLILTGDLAIPDTTAIFDTALVAAVKHFQRRYGLKEDGAIDKNLMAELNRPIEQRIRQILINMERIRWVSADLPSDYLLVNIPAYTLYVYEDGKLNWTMGVVVGAVAHNTVIFQGDMKYVVFSPYWNVPPSIIKNEILPGIKRNPRYLAQKNMEWNGGNVRQKPGPSNSLGLVKFLFPNSYNIYLHDTPSKSLFAETNRAFSHGCIRLSQPEKLADYLLRNDTAWTPDKIHAAMNAGKEKYVTLKKTVPVFIGYFTAWVGSNGDLNFRDDVYGHDKKMEAKMFTN